MDCSSWSQSANVVIRLVSGRPTKDIDLQDIESILFNVFQTTQDILLGLLKVLPRRRYDWDLGGLKQPPRELKAYAARRWRHQSP